MNLPITQGQIESALQSRGLQFKDRGRYLLTQAPCHDDRTPSCQIYKDDWFVNCHKCGRFAPQVAFPELKQSKPHQKAHYKGRQAPYKDSNMQKTPNTHPTHQDDHYKPYDLIDYWKTLAPLTTGIKNIPAEILNDMGWRLNDGKHIWGQEGDIFIPYFNSLKTKVPFAQVRHLSGDRRFSFLKDAKPTVYGSWNLHPSNGKIFVVEGASDCAALDYLVTPWIGLPSSSSIALIKKLGEWCRDNKVELVYAGDKDEAGDKLRTALGEVTHFRVYQAPDPYKDWAEYLEAVGWDEAYKRAAAEFWR